MICNKCTHDLSDMYGMLKLWPLLYKNAKVHEIAIDAMVIYSYKWPKYSASVFYDAYIRFTGFIISMLQ